MSNTPISVMADFLIKRYSGETWRRRVLAMSDAQIQAIYFKTLRSDENAKQAKKRLCGTQTRMNLEAHV